MKIRCKNCGQKFSFADDVELENVESCTNCGVRDWEILENKRLYCCPDCGHVISRYARFCPHCGAGYKNEAIVTVQHLKIPLGEMLNLVFYVLVSLFLIGLIPFAIIKIIAMR